MDGETSCEYARGALPEAEMGEARIHNVEDAGRILRDGYFEVQEPENAGACEPTAVQIASDA